MPPSPDLRQAEGPREDLGEEKIGPHGVKSRGASREGGREEYSGESSEGTGSTRGAEVADQEPREYTEGMSEGDSDDQATHPKAIPHLLAEIHNAAGLIQAQVELVESLLQGLLQALAAEDQAGFPLFLQNGNADGTDRPTNSHPDGDATHPG